MSDKRQYYSGLVQRMREVNPQLNREEALALVLKHTRTSAELVDGAPPSEVEHEVQFATERFKLAWADSESKAVG